VCVRVRVCAREYNMIGFFVQGVLWTKCQIRLAASDALWLCNDLPDLAVFQLVVVSVDVYTLGLVRQ
jgi:hypothetical protein